MRRAPDIRVKSLESVKVKPSVGTEWGRVDTPVPLNDIVFPGISSGSDVEDQI